MRVLAMRTPPRTKRVLLGSCCSTAWTPRSSDVAARPFPGRLVPTDRRFGRARSKSTALLERVLHHSGSSSRARWPFLPPSCPECDEVLYSLSLVRKQVDLSPTQCCVERLSHDPLALYPRRAFPARRSLAANAPLSRADLL